MINVLLLEPPPSAKPWQPGMMSDARRAELDRLYDAHCTLATKHEDACFDSLEADQ